VPGGRFGLEGAELTTIAEQIAAVAKSGVQVAVVVAGELRARRKTIGGGAYPAGHGGLHGDAGHR